MSDYTLQIADLLRARGQQAADLALRKGDIAAQRDQQIGQTGAATLNNWFQYKQQEPARELQKVQLAEAKGSLQQQTRERSFASDLGSVMAATPHVADGESGVSVYDIPAISKTMADHGWGDHLDLIVKHLGPINDAFRTQNASTLALVRQGADSIRSAGNDPDLALQFLDTLDKNHSLPKETVQKYRDQITSASDPQAKTAIVGKITNAIGSPLKITDAPAGSAARDQFGNVIHGSQVPERPTAPTRASLALAAQGDPNDPKTQEAAAALAKLAPPAPSSAKPLEQQLLDAIRSGDKDLEGQIRNAMNARDANMGGPGSEQLVKVFNPDGTYTWQPRSKAAGQTAAPPVGADDPTLPRGVKEYLFDLSQKPFASAITEFKSALPSLVRDHPKLDVTKAVKALGAVYRSDPNSATAIGQLLMDLGGKGTPPPTGAAAPSAPAPSDPSKQTPAPVSDFFKDKGAGTVTFSDGTQWTKAANGTITKIK